MSGIAEIVLTAILLVDLAITATSRLKHCIHLAAVQGILIGLLPLASKGLALENWVVAVVNLGVKGIALPLLLLLAMRRAKVKRELDPMIGYSTSVLVALGITLTAFVIGSGLHAATADKLSMPVALATMLIGLFMIVSRRKAITQVIGFLVFENGITIFGTGLMVEYGLLVELGILLDVFVLVFVMGIAVFQISREFEHIDADRLRSLGDVECKGANK